MAVRRDMAGFGPGGRAPLAWLPLDGPGDISGRQAARPARRRRRAEALPRLGAAAIPWILLIMLAPVSGEQVQLPGLDKAIWMGADLAALAFLVLRRDLASTLFGSRPIILLWPALAILSAAWSLTPGISAYHGLQLLATIVAGIALRATVGLSGVVRIVFLGLLGGQILSVVLGVAAPGMTRGLSGEWSGVYSHKNVLGGLMSLQLLCAASLFLQGWNRVLTGVAFLGALALLASSHSATALMAGVLGLAPLSVIMAWRQGNLVTGFCLGVAIALAGIGVLVGASYGADLSASLLSDLGKDTTLTGRTILWQFGIDQFWREPVIGIGYKAYWESPITTAPYLHFTTKQKVWFFHNNFIDIAVAFGTVGLLVFSGVMLDTARRVILHFARSPGYIEAWPILFLAQLSVLICFECPLFVNHGLHQFLLAAILPVLRTRPET
ncbi:O-antigen ligase family protein [Methylobacterium sp. E-066]|uniref:O-antigen ligase family protein n=1 Tax=Methylobacterium sp. E-066 TaxID=2836584 RepID=UPI001FB992F6|nr:O-antigen ligase family protein [Methylobacterium sp. E-066]MCJ2142024.1 O-antigen ligase family protein [Methylobacterium sp. E-066]